jgi:hypothetical protein
MNSDRPRRTVAQMVATLRLSCAKQQGLFFRNRKERFRWEQSLFSSKEQVMHTKQSSPTLYRQGDVLFRRIDNIPRSGAVKRENGVIALGEVTGHSHAIADLEAAEVLDCGQGLYVHVNEDGVSITHQEHGTIDLPAGDYQVTIQREYSPDAIRSVID